MSHLYNQNWDEFIALVEDEVFPLYAANEEAFDFVGWHSRMHIARALIFGEVMSRYYERSGEVAVDVFSVRWGIAFHDSGRQGNGKDLWEENSAQLCQDFLEKHGLSSEEGQAIARLIISKEKSATPSKQLIHDADVLDILRFFCTQPNGLDRFEADQLKFLSGSDRIYTNGSQEHIRAKLIQDAYRLIKETEVGDHFFEPSHCLTHLCNYLSEHQHAYPFLTALLFEAPIPNT